MERASTTTYALLGLLAIRSWTGYELTQQAKRSLHYLWPSSEAHLYREQKRLVRAGWATVEKERVGRRTRNRYTITPAGREAFRAWLETPPEAPRLEIEGLLRTFFAEQGSPDALERSLRTTAAQTRESRDWLVDRLHEYDDDGPFPERIHLIAIAVDLVTELLERIETFMDEAADEVRDIGALDVRAWDDLARLRLERTLRRSSDPGS